MPDPQNLDDQPDMIDVADLPEDDGLVFACRFDGNGGGSLGDWSAIDDWMREGAVTWMHLDRTSPRAQRWMREESGLTPVTVEALLDEETRPRAFFGKRGTIAILRGVNTNAGADAEELVALRIWCDGARVISVRHRRLKTPRDILGQMLNECRGPKTASELFERLITRLTERLGVMIAGYDDELDRIEASMLELDPGDVRSELQDARQDIVVLRRYMAPQREAVNMIYSEPPPWLADAERLQLRETTNRLTQYIEALDAARERASVLDDGIANRQAEKMNKNMYVLSVIAAIFLPLGFVTGLFGINVGGMPGVESPNAFWVTCLGVGVIVLIELLIFRFLKWI